MFPKPRPPVLMSPCPALGCAFQGQAGSYLAGILLALGISRTYQLFSYDGAVVVITWAVANLSADDGNSDFLQGVRDA